jgi:hypothetical protein
VPRASDQRVYFAAPRSAARSPTGSGRGGRPRGGTSTPGRPPAAPSDGGTRPFSSDQPLCPLIRAEPGAFHTRPTGTSRPCRTCARRSSSAPAQMNATSRRCTGSKPRLRTKSDEARAPIRRRDHRSHYDRCRRQLPLPDPVVATGSFTRPQSVVALDARGNVVAQARIAAVAYWRGAQRHR